MTRIAVISIDTIDKIRNNRDELLQSGKYYEALQLYKTMYHRLSTKKNYSAVIELLTDGAKQLLLHSQGNAAGELAIQLIDTYNKAKQPINNTEIHKILSLFWSFPSDSNTPRVTFMKSAIKWSIAAYNNFITPNTNKDNKDNKDNLAESKSSVDSSITNSPHPHGCPDFHLSFARYYRSCTEPVDYNAAHSHYLLASKSQAIFANQFPLDYTNNNYTIKSGKVDYLNSNYNENIANSGMYNDLYKEHGSLLLKWIELGNRSETDLFITRTVLQYLCLSDLKGANQLLNSIMTELANRNNTNSSIHEVSVQELSGEPLIHFIQFLLKTVERSAGPLFDLLKYKYSLALTRDSNLNSYLDKIGAIYFGRPQPKGMLDSILSGMASS